MKILLSSSFYVYFLILSNTLSSAYNYQILNIFFIILIHNNADSKLLLIYQDDISNNKSPSPYCFSYQ